MMMPALPGTAFKVIESQFVLELPITVLDHGVELWVGRPAVLGKPLIVSGREWERTGCGVDGEPTALADTQRRGQPDFDATLKRMGIETPQPGRTNQDGAP